MQFVNCLKDFPLCILIISFNILDIYIHCHKIIICTMCECIISFNINWRFRINENLCINIIRISTGFFNNFFSINRFFNLFIYLICFLCNIMKMTNCFFILFINICRSFNFLIQCYRIYRNFFWYPLCDNRFSCFVIFLTTGSSICSLSLLKKLSLLLSAFQYMQQLLPVHSLLQMVLLFGHWHLTLIPIN